MTGFAGPGYVDGSGGPNPSRRLGYLDWARGLAVLAMIETHGFNAWTVADDRDTPLFGVSRVVGGFSAPLFLFVSGLAAALVAEKARSKGSSSGDVRRRAVRRGLTVFAYAFVFRLGMWVSGGFGPAADLLRVDVLNCIAVSLLLVAATLGAEPARLRAGISLALSAVIALATPLVWDGAWWHGWPTAIAGYATGRVPGAVFPVFPWAAFALLGAGCGGVLAVARAHGKEGRTIAALALVGAAAIPIALLGDRHFPSLYPTYDFWYTSPAFALVKAGVLLGVLGLAYLADALPGPSALRPLGRASLLVYWVHLEIVYGRWIAPGARESLSIEEATWGVIALALAMLALAVGRTTARGWGLRGRELAKA
jgi:uncharacterized membrane protein